MRLPHSGNCVLHYYPVYMCVYSMLCTVCVTVCILSNAILCMLYAHMLYCICFISVFSVCVCLPAGSACLGLYQCPNPLSQRSMLTVRLPTH